MKIKEIENIQDIHVLVDTFYGKIRQDDLLKDIFNTVIQNRWPEHLAKMYTFWQTILLKEYTYEGAPFPPHARLKVNKIHFERWVFLFNETVDELFVGENATLAKWQGQRMADTFLSKIIQLR